MIKFDLSKLLKEEIGGSTKDLVTRPTARPFGNASSVTWKPHPKARSSASIFRRSA